MMNQAIISIKPQYVDLILSLEKTVEIRNRIVRMKPKTRIWIYATKPVSSIVASAEVESVEHLTPSEAWNRFGCKICIERGSFDSYIRNKKLVSALILTSVQKLHPSVTLDLMRRLVNNFHPPQFYSHLSRDCRLSGTLNEILLQGEASITELASITNAS